MRRALIQRDEAQTVLDAMHPQLYSSVEEIMQASGLDRRSVRNALRRLNNRNLIRIAKSGKNLNYRKVSA